MAETSQASGLIVAESYADVQAALVSTDGVMSASTAAWLEEAGARAAAIVASNEAIIASDEEVAGASETAAGGSALVTAGTTLALAAVVAGGFKLSSFLDSDYDSAMKAASDMTKTWTESLDSTGGVINSTTTAAAAASLQQDGLAKKAAAAGVSLTQLSSGLTGSDEDFENLIATWEKGGKPSAFTIGSLIQMRDSLDKTSEEAKKLAETNKELDDGYDGLTTAQIAQAKALDLSGSDYTKATQAVTAKAASDKEAAAEAAITLQQTLAAHPVWAQNARDLGQTASAYVAAQSAAKSQTDSTRSATQAMQVENDVAGLLGQALDGLNKNTLDVAQAHNQFLDAIDQATAGIKDNGKSLDDNTAKGRANQEAFLSAITSAQDYAKAQANSGITTTQATKDYQANIAELKASAIAAGLNAAQVDALIKKYGAVPKLVKTQAEVDSAAALAKVNALKAQINSIKQGKVPGLTANNDAGRAKIGELQSQINRLTGKNVLIGIDGNSLSVAESQLAQFKADIDSVDDPLITVHPPVHRATGGIVTGPGTHTSDSIPAMLSDDEFVEPADATRKNLGALEAARHGAVLTVAHYAKGGLVGTGKAFDNGSSPKVMSGGWQIHNLNITLDPASLTDAARAIQILEEAAMLATTGVGRQVA